MPFEVSNEFVGKSSDCILEKQVRYKKVNYSFVNATPVGIPTLLKFHRNMNLPKHRKVCRDWTTAEFINCLESKIREDIIRNNFTCSIIWHRQFFPNETRPCSMDDLDEVIKIG